MASLFDRILNAHAAVRPQVLVTPLTYSAALSKVLDCEVHLKCDHLQPTGSFKIRGASNKVRLLDAASRRSGVITASTGNHGMALAHAGAAAGVGVTVFAAAGSAPSKLETIRALGAELVLIDGSALEAEQEARRQARTWGRPYVSPYNDLDTVAGQGTLGVELFNQLSGIDAVFICVGGGGLIGGAGTALKRMRPGAKVVGCWPAASPCMLRSMEAGEVVATEEFETISDGSAGGVEPGALTLPICREVVDDTVEVSEPEIHDAMKRVGASERWIIEGSAGVAVAGLVKRREAYRGAKVAVVICGRNIALETWVRAVG